MTPIFEDVLRALLVGTDVTGTRVFLERAPQVPADQAKTPYLVFGAVGDEMYHTQGAAVTLYDRDYQVDIYDPSQSRAVAIADTLRRKLDGVRGDYAGVRIGGMYHKARTATYEDLSSLHHVILTFRIQFEFLPEFENFTIQPRKPNVIERRKTL